MKKEQLFTRRRALLAGAAAAVGAAGTAGVFAWGDKGEPVRGAVPAAGAPARSLPLKPSAYRLQPLTGYGPRAPRQPAPRCATNPCCG